VLAAHRWYGIYHQNKESNIRDLKRADAIQFVESLRAEEENVTVAAAAPQPRAERTLVTPTRPAKAAQRDESHEKSAKPSGRSLALSPVSEDSEDELDVLPPEQTRSPEAPKARAGKSRAGKRKAH
jgi:hypothetical protein